MMLSLLVTWRLSQQRSKPYVSDSILCRFFTLQFVLYQDRQLSVMEAVVRALLLLLI